MTLNVFYLKLSQQRIIYEKKTVINLFIMQNAAFFVLFLLVSECSAIVNDKKNGTLDRLGKGSEIVKLCIDGCN